MSKKFTTEKSLFYIIIAAVIIAVIVVAYLYFVFGAKSIKIISPNGEEQWDIGQKYEITWRAKNVGKVGIVLFNNSGEAEWIAENIDAGLGKYGWEIYKGHQYGYGFWIAVFEYPWRKNGKVDYSNNGFSITYPDLSSCESLSAQNEWLYLPSDFPDIRKVFITQNTYAGDLGGLGGADQKCQQEAEKMGIGGSWTAFIGGDADEETAVERLKKTERKTNGIFVQAEPSASLLRGATCHRLLGKNFNEFLAKIYDSLLINREKLDSGFLKQMESVWLGRLDQKSKKSCINVTSLNKYLPEKYSLTTTCQNWTRSDKFVDGYPLEAGGTISSFPTCYTSSGTLTNVVSLGALKLGLADSGDNSFFSPALGEYCSEPQRLFCIEN